ncbi:MAG: hypothetical protein U1F00_12875 [Rhodoferax sp.]
MLAAHAAWAGDSFAMQAAGAFDTALPRTHLIELQQGSDLSRKASALAYGGYETAQGQWVDMQRWYGRTWTDTHVAWMTQVSPQWGLIWGFGTGERADKYTIAPSVKLGLAFAAEPRRNHFLSFRATATLGGALKERACTADYGAIGGVQAVNCRMAASTLAPADTLRYLLNERPRNRNTLFVEYRHAF